MLPTWLKAFFATKPVHRHGHAPDAHEHPQGGLHRTLGLLPLTMIGVGATVGTGIFFTLTEAVPKAGPSVLLSFLLAALTAGLTALCYAELSFRVPAAGSSYSFAYATVGEFPAFIVAFCLLLEYGLAGSATAIGWSDYLNNFLQLTTGWQIPEALRKPMLVATPEGVQWVPGQVNLAPIVLVALCGVLLLRGTRLPGLGGTGYVVVFDDITHVLQAQRDAAWTEVARRLAHEIKNPLTPIQLSAERLQFKLASKLAPGDADMLARSTQTIVNQVSALKNMVDAFRQYARMPEPSRQDVDFNELVREVLMLYESLAGRLQVELSPGLPKIVGDSAQLRQVIHNLLQNAEDALAGVENPRITLRTECSAGGLRVTIADNGSGFPAELIKRVFEPYVTTKPKGTGLGLVIAKKIIEEHGGTVEIANVSPHGARVTLDFPGGAVHSASVKSAARA